MVRDYLAGSSPFRDLAPTPADAFCMEYRAYQDAPVNRAVRLIHKLVGGDSHQWLYDHSSIETLLREAGFSEITPRSYREGDVPDLDVVEHRERGLFIEAR